MGDQVHGEPHQDLLGRAATVRRTVDEPDTALALGSGDVPVLGTPRLLAWLEAATVAALSSLSAATTSVGSRVEVEHLRASRVGATVTCTATVVAVAARTVVLDVEAYGTGADGFPVVVAQGRVTRQVVDRARFLARLDG